MRRYRIKAALAQHPAYRAADDLIRRLAKQCRTGLIDKLVSQIAAAAYQDQRRGVCDQLQLGLAGTQCLLGLALLGYVDGHTADERRLAIGKHNRKFVYYRMMRRSVAVPEGLDRLHTAALDREFVILAKCRGDLGRKDLLVGLSIDTAAGDAKGLRSGLVDKNIAARGIFYPRQTRQKVHETLKELLALRERFLDYLSVGDVDARADVTEKLARGRRPRYTVR